VSKKKNKEPNHYFGKPGAFALARNQAGGDWAAGVLLYRVKYRLRPEAKKLKRHDKEWVAMSRNDWAREAGLSDGEMRNRALPKLRKRQFITIRQMKISPNGPKLLWMSIEWDKLHEWTDQPEIIDAQLNGTGIGFSTNELGNYPYKHAKSGEQFDEEENG